MKDIKTKEYFFKKLLDIKKKKIVTAEIKRKLNRKVRKKKFRKSPRKKNKDGKPRVHIRVSGD